MPSDARGLPASYQILAEPREAGTCIADLLSLPGRMPEPDVYHIKPPHGQEVLMLKIIAAGLVVVAVVLLALAALSYRSGRIPPQCSARIVIVPTPRGAPLECVCDAGVLATCFSPGP
jgi:hypothetical protein